MALNPTEIAQSYFDAWNRHDAAAIVEGFANGGTYADPATQGPLSGDAIGAYAEALWAAFPDVSFDIAGVIENGSGLVSAEWLMKGTNTGSFNGLPPSGASVALAGADFVRVEGDRIRSVQGYFDSAAIARAMGLDVIIQPRSIGPFTFGASNRAWSGSTAIPGAFSITCLEARNPEEQQEITESSRNIVAEMLAMPGFISSVGAVVGDRMMTVTAWETPDAMAPLMKGGEHRSAAVRFFGPELARGGATGVWIPSRLNPRRIRCSACSKMADADTASGVCVCGASLPAPLAYW